MVKTVVVSMFFNLSKLKDSNINTRPVEFYLEKGREILHIDSPMVIFCDSSTKEPIKQIRDRLVPENETLYIEKDIDEYDFYKHNWDIIQLNRSKSIVSSIYRTSRVTSSYFLMGMFKPLAIKIAAQKISATHYVWMDFGCAHIAPHDLRNSAMMILNNPRPKVCICYIHYRSAKELNNIVDFTNSGGCGIATTIFSVEAEYVGRLYSATMSIFYEKLSRGVGHTDETVFTYCYDRYPELFTIYHGDYYSVLQNYHHVRRDWHLVNERFIAYAKIAGRDDLAKEAVISILKGYYNRTSDFPESKIDSILNTLA